MKPKYEELVALYYHEAVTNIWDNSGDIGKDTLILYRKCCSWNAGFYKHLNQYEKDDIGRHLECEKE